MGKKRITKLLEQLETNHQQELQNAATIFTVAQGAVNKLGEQISGDIGSATAALLSSPVLLTKDDLLKQYGSYNKCRSAASKKGIKFKSNPTWGQLVAAFSYFQNFQQLVKSYLQIHPNPDLRGLSIQIKIES